MTLKNNSNITIQYSVTVTHIQRADGEYAIHPSVTIFNHMTNSASLLILNSSSLSNYDLDKALLEIKNWINIDVNNLILNKLDEDGPLNISILWHSMQYVRNDHLSEWEEDILPKNTTVITIKTLPGEEGEEESYKPLYALMSIDKCLINFNSIVNWESIIEEIFGGESSRMDLSLNNLQDSGNFFNYYKNLVESSASVLDFPAM